MRDSRIACDATIAPVVRAWTAEQLRATVASGRWHDGIVVLANRLPYQTERRPDGTASVRRSPGGVVTVLEPILQSCAGVWVGSAPSLDPACDDQAGRLFDQAAEASGYRIRPVPIDRAENDGYYVGFANEGLWPLCHRAHVQPVFRSCDYAEYEKVNRRFADAACDAAAGPSPLILVQDYHLARVPMALRTRMPASTIVAFWHIPWPHPRDFETCPWAAPLLEGLLASTIAGFQTPQDCRNFLETAEWSLGAQVSLDDQTVTFNGRRTMVRAYPVSIAWPGTAAALPVAVCRRDVRREHGLEPGTLIGVGIDRLDYTKGIEEKLLAVERLLEQRADLRGRFVFVQIAEPSRQSVPAYRELRCRVLRTAARINARFTTAGRAPIHVVEAHQEPSDVCRYLRAADVCYVGSLHDGMNLVAKEFVASRDDERGVLVLSRFAGAALQLHDAFLVNPYAVDETAGALALALEMPAAEQTRRMAAMREQVRTCNAYRWAGDMLLDAQAARRRALKVAQAFTE